ncbi:2-succinyl-6-hydroxy-2,4-cyclohexadiene-1-carboxylate synthase [uncultured archaeon]|nr:2-succinyl-6-hydroxy-2,4-cyclohexadiene-1-carboxylate synthase [uncultured archaeon]
MEEITFITEDGVKISGNYFKPKKEHAPVFLLLHMMPATKESWTEFATRLQEKGFAALAIDLRGHGSSTDKNGSKLDYKEFKDHEHRESMKDIAAAKEFLKGQANVDISGMAIAGASIGANLALWQASIDKDVSLLILLSPGLNYRGIQAAQLAPHYSGPVYILASEMDATNAAQSSRELFKIFPGDKELEIIKRNSHGTNMFISEPGLIDKLLEWTTNKIYKY